MFLIVFSFILVCPISFIWAPESHTARSFLFKKILFCTLILNCKLFPYFVLFCLYIYFYFSLVPNFRERDFICHEKKFFSFINCSIAILLIRNRLLIFAKKTNNLLIPALGNWHSSCVPWRLSFKQIYRTTFFENKMLSLLFVYTHVDAK